MTMIIVVLLCVSLILAGAVLPKPIGWIVLSLAVLALLFGVLGGLPLLVPHKS